MFGDAVQASQLELAQTAQLLYAAESASTEVRVAMVHPDWDDEQVQAEAAKVLDEKTASVPDPFGQQLDPMMGDLSGDAAGNVGQ